MLVNLQTGRFIGHENIYSCALAERRFTFYIDEFNLKASEPIKSVKCMNLLRSNPQIQRLQKRETME